MAKEVNYSQKEQDAAQRLLDVMEQQQQVITHKKQEGARGITREVKSLLTNVTKLNALLDRVPADYTPIQ